MEERLKDIIPEDETILLIVGESVGKKSYELKHYYAAPNNQFWKLLKKLIGRELTCYEDKEIVKYGIGLTDIIKDKVGLNDVEPDRERFKLYFDRLRSVVDEHKPKMIVFNSKFTYEQHPAKSHQNQ